MRPRTKWIVTGAVFFLLLLPWLIAPAATARSIKSMYHSMPDGLRSAVPDAAEESVGRSLDAVARFFAFGSAARLADLDLRLESASLAPGSWGPNHTLSLSWTDLGPGISYQLRAGHGATPGGVDVALGTSQGPQAVVELPGDGEWYVRIKVVSGSAGGRETTFGPFRIDSSPPSSPTLNPIPPPPGYSFSISWTPGTDASGIAFYIVERLGSGTLFQPVAKPGSSPHWEDQLGNGKYRYRVRAVNGAGLMSAPSNEEEVVVKAPMQNPGAGKFRYGIHANYTSFIKLWDLTNPSKYASIRDVPSGIGAAYLGGGYGFETSNHTLVAETQRVVGAETNTMRVAELLFRWLYDYADYDSEKLNASLAGGEAGLQRAGLTYDLRKGICGDLATLYITMLRIAGVPARAVHGYLDNPSAGIGDFHVWVEVWVGASLRSSDPSDTRDDWMTVDVSGITGPFDPNRFLVYFGIFNPDYLALGLRANYQDRSWNSWAQFGWSRPPSRPDPSFTAEGRPVVVSEETMDLMFNPTTKERRLVANAQQAATPGFTQYFPDVTVVSKKRIDYGVNIQGPAPTNATIRLRFPDADAYAAVLPWQSVIYTVYTSASTVNAQPGGKLYASDAIGYVIWEDDFR